MQKLKTKEAYLPVCYDQLWVSYVMGDVTNCTQTSSWKEVFAISFVHWELIKEQDSYSQQMLSEL